MQFSNYTAYLTFKFYHIWMNDINNMYKITEKEQAEKAWPNGEQPITDTVSFLLEKELLKLYCSTKGASIAYRHSKLSHGKFIQDGTDDENH